MGKKSKHSAARARKASTHADQPSRITRDLVTRVGTWISLPSQAADNGPRDPCLQAVPYCFATKASTPCEPMLVRAGVAVVQLEGGTEDFDRLKSVPLMIDLRNVHAVRRVAGIMNEMNHDCFMFGRARYEMYVFWRRACATDYHRRHNTADWRRHRHTILDDLAASLVVTDEILDGIACSLDSDSGWPRLVERALGQNSDPSGSPRRVKVLRESLLDRISAVQNFVSDALTTISSWYPE